MSIWNEKGVFEPLILVLIEKEIQSFELFSISKEIIHVWLL
jgi:hypothetical protein